jgi:hypothetical protein
MASYQNNQHQLDLIDVIVKRGYETIQAKSKGAEIDVIALQTQVFFCECLDISEHLPNELKPVASVMRLTMEQQIKDANEGLIQIASHAMMLGTPTEEVIPDIYMMFVQVFSKYFPNSKLWALVEK